MTNPHVHHILFKTGNGPTQQRLVAEGIMILGEVGIDFTQKENLVWAELQEGQHMLTNHEEVVNELRRLKDEGASKKQFLQAR